MLFFHFFNTGVRQHFSADCIVCFLSMMLLISDAGCVRNLNVTGVVFHTASKSVNKGKYTGLH